MTRITQEEAKKLGIKIKPTKTIQEKIIDIVIEKVNKKSKYGSEITEVNKIKFDSKKEANRYNELILLQKSKKIYGLKLQPKFILQESFKYNGKTEKSINYIADFMYFENKRYVVEDCKGFKTKTYKIKRKLFLKKYGNFYIFKET